MFRVWYDVGVGMNLQNIPDTPAKMLAFKNVSFAIMSRLE